MAQDSSRPDFWESRYRDGVTPWDAGRSPADLAAYLAEAKPGSRILVPGCGTGYEVEVLARQGFDVVAIDFSPAAVQVAQANLGALASRVRLADFFDFDPGDPFDAIYERAFLCALPPRTWPSYARRTAELLKPDGEIAGFFFFADTPRGPPFGTSEAALKDLLGPVFTRVADRAVADSIEVFRGKERWQVWRRTA